MKTNNKLRSLVLLAALAIGSTTALCQTNSASAEPDDLRAVFETFRSDINGYKVHALNQAMQLTGPEAEKFWPIYRQYEQALAGVGEKKAALLREFGERVRNGTLDNQAASKLSQAWLDNIQGRLDLWKKYRKKIAKALSPARAAQFLQVENQMALFIDLNIAAEMPALRTVIKDQ
jgi:hypothetical protein